MSVRHVGLELHGIRIVLRFQLGPMMTKQDRCQRFVKARIESRWMRALPGPFVTRRSRSLKPCPRKSGPSSSSTNRTIATGWIKSQRGKLTSTAGQTAAPCHRRPSYPPRAALPHRSRSNLLRSDCPPRSSAVALAWSKQRELSAIRPSLQEREDLSSKWTTMRVG